MLAAASLALAGLPGCAFIFTQGPPPPERQAKETYFDCSGSWVPVIVDALLATAAGINAGAAYDSQTVANPHGVAVVAAGTAVLFVTSAIYGVTAVASCGRAKTARLERKQREELLPSPYGVPPYGVPPPYWPPPVAFYRAPTPAVVPKAAGKPAVTPESPAAAPGEEPGAPGVPAPPAQPAAPVFKAAPPATPPGS